MKGRNVIPIDSCDHWADYAEMISPPQPDYERAKDNLFHGLRNGLKFNWNVCIAVVLGAVVWMALLAFGKMVWLSWFQK